MGDAAVWHGRVHAAGAGVPGTVVSDGRAVVRTDESGGFALPVDPAARFVFLSVPAGYRCADWYAHTDGRDPGQSIEFALEAAPERGTADFAVIQVTDIHVCVDHDEVEARRGDSLFARNKATGKHGRVPLTQWEELAVELTGIAQREPAAVAILLTGDLANSGLRTEHEAFARALAATPVDTHCIPGNHDWMDEHARERNYEAVLGPRYYSFNIGQIHFVATDWWELDQYPDTADRQRAWMMNDLATQPTDTPIVLLTHDQFPENLLTPYRGHRLLATFSGHKHATRVFDDGQTQHFNTPTFMFGGYDHSPRCYRVARFSGDTLHVETKSAQQDGPTARCTFAASRKPALEQQSGTVRTNGAWSQYHGGPGRGGRATDEIAPPLTQAWTAHLGDALNLGGPIVADGLVFVGLQREDAPGGALVGLDAVTGEERWRVPTASAVKRTPAVADGKVVACTVTGELFAVDGASGEVQWRYQLGDPSLCWIYTAPVITDGVVCLGEAFHFAAVDLHTGEPRWVRTDFGEVAEFINMSSPAALDGKVFASFFWQVQNFAALDVRTGETLWAHTEGNRRGAMAGAAVADGRVYVTRVTMRLECLDAESGELHWRTRLGSVFSQATPAIGPDTVYAVGGLGHVQALDAETGEPRWTWQAEQALLDTAPYMRGTPNTVAAPVLAGRYLYIPSNCGRLTALDTADGRVAWQHDFGVPLPGAPAASGNALFVPAADGSLTAMVAS